MNIAWYTPFSEDSVIGRFSCLVVAAVRERGATVQIIRSENKSPALRDATAADPTEHFLWAADLGQNLPKRLQQYDLVVYNVGDRYDDHFHSFQHQPLVAGLTLLHDGCLHHAMHNHCRRTLRATVQYRELLEAECGPEATNIYDRLLQTDGQQAWWHEEIARFPVYRWALQDTLGIVTHADYYRDTVAASIGCPTTTIPFAYDIPTPPAADSSRLANHKLTILTVGAVNTNKRHQAVIRALGTSPQLRERFRFRIVGSADSAQQRVISSAVKSCVKHPDVSVTGPVTREGLHRELANADIMACLHHPAMEGATASIAEGMLSGKPAIVSRTACSAEIPDGLAYKVPQAHEHTQIADALTQILHNYPAALDRAKTAQQWAQPRHAPEAYADRVLEFAGRVLYNRPVLQLADRIAEHLQRWNTQVDPDVLQRVDTAMYDLFGKPDNRRRAA